MNGVKRLANAFLLAHENTYYLLMFEEVIAKAKSLLIEINKIGVGTEGGGPAPHESGPFGNNYPRLDADDPDNHTNLPENVAAASRPHFKGEQVVKDVSGVQNGGFSTTTDYPVKEDDKYNLPQSLNTADNCTDTSPECAKKLHTERRQTYDTGLTAQSSISTK